MRVLSKTVQERRARINCDSLLSFGGVNQYGDAGVNPNVLNAIDFDTNFTISCFVYLPSTATGNQIIFGVYTNNPDEVGQNGVFNLILHENGNRYALQAFFLQQSNEAFRTQRTDHVLQKGRLYHITLLKTAIVNPSSPLSTGYFRILVNNQELTITSTFGSGGFISTIKDSSSKVFIGGFNTVWASSYSSLGINNLVVVSSPTPDAEIQQIHRYGGLLPESTHASCVAHYAAGSYGQVVQDLVTDYNQAKIDAGLPTLTAYPATLQNFTDAEVGIPNQSTNTAYLDFYDRTPIVS